MTLLDAAKVMARTFHPKSFTSLAEACRFLHEQHPANCGGKQDAFENLRPCSCSLNQLISALRHGQAALEVAIRDAEAQGEPA